MITPDLVGKLVVLTSTQSNDYRLALVKAGLPEADATVLAGRLRGQMEFSLGEWVGEHA